jgi:hypothetical protein
MTDEKNPVEQALDVLLYAPLGLVFSARDLLPTLAEKGRAQLGVAKMIGQFAVQQGQKQAMSTLESLAGQGKSNGHAAPSAPSPAPATPAPAPAAPSVPTSGPEAAALAIPDYDSLSASQVLPRLQGLSAGELEAVRDYEAAHRGRKTILNRVTQLQST